MRAHSIFLRFFCAIFLLPFLSANALAGQVYSNFSDHTLAPSLVSDLNLDPARSIALQGRIAAKYHPGAIGRGSPLLELAQGELPQKLFIPPHVDRYEFDDKVYQAIDIAVKLMVDAENMPSQHHERAKKVLTNLILLKNHLSERLYLFSAAIRGPEDYLLGFNYMVEDEFIVGLSFGLVEKLYSISPKRLAQYILHECVPENGMITERDDHGVIYNEIQSAIFGHDEVLALKKNLRAFIDENAPITQSVKASDLRESDQYEYMPNVGYVFTSLEELASAQKDQLRVAIEKAYDTVLSTGEIVNYAPDYFERYPVTLPGGQQIDAYVLKNREVQSFDDKYPVPIVFRHKDEEYVIALHNYPSEENHILVAKKETDRSQTIESPEKFELMFRIAEVLGDGYEGFFSCSHLNTKLQIQFFKKSTPLWTTGTHNELLQSNMRGVMFFRSKEKNISILSEEVYQVWKHYNADGMRSELFTHFDGNEIMVYLVPRLSDMPVTARERVDVSNFGCFEIAGKLMNYETGTAARELQQSPARYIADLKEMSIERDNVFPQEGLLSYKILSHEQERASGLKIQEIARANVATESSRGKPSIGPIRGKRLKEILTNAAREEELVDLGDLLNLFLELNKKELSKIIRMMGENGEFGLDQHGRKIAFLDVINEDGVPTNEITTFSRMHKDFTLHRSVQTIVVTPDDHFIFQFRRYQDSEGKWDIPATVHVDVGELPRDAAARGIKEEIGLDLPSERFVEILPPLWISRILNSGFIKMGTSDMERSDWTSGYGLDGKFRYYGRDDKNHELTNLYVLRLTSSEAKELEESFASSGEDVPKPGDIKLLADHQITHDITAKETKESYASGAMQYFDNMVEEHVLKRVKLSSRPVYAFDYDDTLEISNWPLRRDRVERVARLIEEQGARIAIISAKSLREQGKMEEAVESIRLEGDVEWADKVSEALKDGKGVLQFAGERIIEALSEMRGRSIEDEDTEKLLIFYPSKSNQKYVYRSGQWHQMYAETFKESIVRAISAIFNAEWPGIKFYSPEEEKTMRMEEKKEAYVILHRIKGGNVGKIQLKPHGAKPDHDTHDERSVIADRIAQLLRETGFNDQVVGEPGGKTSIDYTPVGKEHGIIDLVVADNHQSISYYGDDPEGNDRSVKELWQRRQYLGLRFFDVNFGKVDETMELLDRVLGEKPEDISSDKKNAQEPTHHVYEDVMDPLALEIMEDLPVRAKLFAVNISKILADHPDQFLFVGIEKDVGELQKAQMMPLFKALARVQELKDVNGDVLFPNLLVRSASAGELVAMIMDMANDEKLTLSNSFIAARKFSVENKLYNSVMGTGRTWISAIDDSVPGNYLPIVEAITLNMMAHLNADLTVIKNFYDAISDEPVEIDILKNMLKNRVVYILPKPIRVETNQLRELYQEAYKVLIAA